MSDNAIGHQPGTVCYSCHEQFAPGNDTCRSVAVHFRNTLLELSAGETKYTQAARRLAQRGLDTDALEGELTELRDAPLRSRVRIHSFERIAFDESVKDARGSISTADAMAREALSEFRFRRSGLIISIAVMAAMAALLYLKIRQIEKR